MDISSDQMYNIFLYKIYWVDSVYLLVKGYDLLNDRVSAIVSTSERTFFKSSLNPPLFGLPFSEYAGEDGILIALGPIITGIV
jgi:hypothetical protein